MRLVAGRSRATLIRAEIISLKDEVKRRLLGDSEGEHAAATVPRLNRKNILSGVALSFRIAYTQEDFRTTNFDQVANSLKNNFTAATQSGEFTTRFRTELTARGASQEFSNAATPISPAFDSGYTTMRTGFNPTARPTAIPTTSE